VPNFWTCRATTSEKFTHINALLATGNGCKVWDEGALLERNWVIKLQTNPHISSNHTRLGGLDRSSLILHVILSFRAITSPSMKSTICLTDGHPYLVLYIYCCSCWCLFRVCIRAPCIFWSLGIEEVGLEWKGVSKIQFAVKPQYIVSIPADSIRSIVLSKCNQSHPRLFIAWGIF
jgi:hypothetical protein